jgi:hypothetical protein
VELGHIGTQRQRREIFVELNMPVKTGGAAHRNIGPVNKFFYQKIRKKIPAPFGAGIFLNSDKI